MSEAASPPAIQAPAEGVEASVTTQYSTVHYQHAGIGFDYAMVGLNGRVALPAGLAGGLGGRFAYGEQLDRVAFEGFAVLLMEPRLRRLTDDKGRTGSWRPSAGIEIGLTTVKREAFAEPVADIDADQPTLLYGSFVANPARFRVDRFAVSLLGVSFGSSLGSPGRDFRLQLNVVEMGLAF